MYDHEYIDRCLEMKDDFEMEVGWHMKMMQRYESLLSEAS